MQRTIPYRFLHLLFALMFMPLAQADSTDRNLAVDKVEGGLSVMVLGSGGPVAAPSGRASAGYLIFVEGKPRILMDVGGGTYQRVAQSGVDLRDLDIVLLSHLHIDHTGDLSAILKTIYFHNARARTSRTKPIHIYGPAANGVPFPNTTIPQYPATREYIDAHYALPGGTERYLNLFARAITQGKSAFRYRAHDLRSLVPAATVEEVLHTDDGLRIEAIAVDHGPVPAVAFRVSYGGRHIVYSGDTGSTGPNMITLSQGADLLIYDTAVMDDLPANPLFHLLHTEPTRIGEVAAAAGARELLLSHITPVTEPRIKKVKRLIRAQGYRGKIRVARDLQIYNLERESNDARHD